MYSWLNVIFQLLFILTQNASFRCAVANPNWLFINLFNLKFAVTQWNLNTLGIAKYRTQFTDLHRYLTFKYKETTKRQFPEKL